MNVYKNYKYHGKKLPCKMYKIVLILGKIIFTKNYK